MAFQVMGQFVNLNPTNKTAVMEKLFDGRVNDRKEVVWKPDFNEAFNFHVSDDGLCYTKVDTIFNYRGVSGAKYVLYLFATNSKSHGKYDSYHNDRPNISAALFEAGKYSPYKLVAFNKHLTDCGDYGTPCKVELVSLGKDKWNTDTWGILFKDGNMANGMIRSWEYLYTATFLHFDKIFNVTTGGSNSGLATGKIKLHEYSSKTKFLPNENGLDTIVVTATGTWLNENKEIVPVTPRRVFTYKNNLGYYMRTYP